MLPETRDTVTLGPSRRALLLLALTLGTTTGASAAMPSTLASIPVELRGEWHGALEAARMVVMRVREVALAGIPLRSDRQPRRLFVDNHTSGNPQIWLHTRPAKTAWIVTDVGPRDWCRLSYQFGHEFGHVLCNTWTRDAEPQPPCQWLEEVLAESFSLRSLKLLAESWTQNPLFGDAAFSRAIVKYRDTTLSPYRASAGSLHVSALRDLLAEHGAMLAASNGFSPTASAAVPMVVSKLQREPTLIEDYGGLNRWPERSRLPLPDYLARWRDSCREIGTPGRLPAWLARQFGIAV